MNIKHPELIFMLALIPLFVGFFYITWSRRKQALTKLCDASQLKRLFPSSSKRKVLFRYFLLCLAFVLFVLSFISPRWGYEWKEIETKGTNIFIALDMSKSMLAEDVKPNRLTRAKYDVINLLGKLKGDTVGLIIFAGDAFLQCPLTHDYSMLASWVDELQFNAVPVQGTSIKGAINQAIKSFQHLKSDSKALIIISDGEEQDEETIRAARKAKQAGIKIYSVGIGTQEGSPISFDGALVKDENGNIVLSKLDDALLREIAETTGGHYVRAATGDFHLDTIYYEHLRKDLTVETLKTGKSKLWYETYQFFSGIAFLLLLLELLLSLDWRFVFLRKFFYKKRKMRFVAPLWFLLFLLSSLPVRAELFSLSEARGDQALKSAKTDEALANYIKAQVDDPHDPRLNYNMGIAFYREGDFAKSLATFQKSTQTSSDPLLQERALYNLGNSFFKIEKYKEAIEVYEKALKIVPDDEDAKFNLELAKKLLPKTQGDGDPDEDKKGNQNQDKKNQSQNDQDQKNKDDKQNQNDKDKKDQEEKERKEREQQEQRKQDMEALLKQAREANSNDVGRNRMKQESKEKGGTGSANKLKPW